MTINSDRFGRFCVVRIAAKDSATGVEISELRIAFDVSKKEKESEGSITISNASPETIANIKRGSILSINAGYENDHGIIYSGEITEAITNRTTTGSETAIKCRTANSDVFKASVSVGYSGGTSAQDILSDLSSRCGIPVEIDKAIGDSIYVGGYNYFGSIIGAFREVSARLAAKAIVSDGVLYIVPKIGSAPDGSTPVLSADTGLVGFPERFSDEKDNSTIFGWNISALLYHRAKVGGSIKIQSRDIGGAFFQVKEISHSGDTYGDDWTTTFKVYDK